ncbi:Crp/Fnr family transcriptional regulator [Paralimibaculum aggregatum]|uniref:Crp/Fnr family transcriptional regulator n=1 Tax=Paralimibaculum aggregatum TaxID=3036245 RepID=A0ABQ6LDT2_9RHOB|nr:Crp/Fnr family transcriptional regulator [Limibaculum sp. NKW23]GMG81512.1 Crp/Fnr family transcriptional regulator [Limibaculum sp. NKW23]
MASRPFLDRLGDDTRSRLERHWTRRRRGRGETILLAGEDGTSVHFMLAGQARASLASDEGRTVSFRDFAPGDIFGEFSAIDKAPRSASVVALTDVVVAGLAGSLLDRFVAEDPGFARALLAHVTAVSRDMNTRVFEYSTMLMRERLQRELLRLAATGRAAGDGVEIAPAPTHQALADRISSHREAVSREMSRLARAGLVMRRPGALLITDIALLRGTGPGALEAIRPVL